MTARPRLEDHGLSIDPAQAERCYAAGWWRSETILDDFDAAVARDPGKTAVVTRRSADRTRVALSYRELADAAASVAGLLLELGVVPGEVVSLQLPNRWEFLAIALACSRVGAVVNPIIPIHREREVRFIVGLVESRVLFVPDTFRGFDHAGLALALRDELPRLEHVVVLDGERPGALSFERDARGHAAADPAALEARRPAADDLAEVQFTSGTTGEPKGVAHTFNTQFARTRAMWEPLGLGAEDTVLMSSTLAHSSGFLYGYMVPMSRGGTSVLQDVWDADAALAFVEEEGVTWSMGSTTFVVDAINAQRERPRDLRTLTQFVSGGAAIPPPVVRDAADVLGTRLVAVWGLTENGGVTINRPEDAPDAAARSDGRPVAWMEVRAVDDDGRDVPTGDVGRLVLRGASQTVGYFRRPEVYRAQLDADGWFDTGDLGRFDADGNVRIKGRVKDLIVRGGENVPVVEVEAALYSHPAVAEIAVVACPDERLGERACAVVVPAAAASPTLAELTEHLAQIGMTKTYWPERVELVAALPKTLSGKVQKFKLRAWLAGDADAAPDGVGAAR